MHFQVKSTLKNKRNHTLKQALTHSGHSSDFRNSSI